MAFDESRRLRPAAELADEDAAADSDIIITAKVQENIVGYICLKNYSIFDGDIYIEQIAVAEKYQRFGIGEQLFKNAINYAKIHGYGKMYANCRKINEISQSLLKKIGFIEFDMTEEQYLGIGFSPEHINDNYAFLYNII